MRTVYVLNENAKPGEPSLVRRPDRGELRAAQWHDLRAKYQPLILNEEAATSDDIEAVYRERLARIDPNEFRRETEGLWVQQGALQDRVHEDLPVTRIGRSVRLGK